MADEDPTAPLRRKLHRVSNALAGQTLVKNTKGGEKGGKKLMYADLNQVLEVVKTALHDEDLTIMQPIGPVPGMEGYQQLSTVITDDDGNWIQFPGPMMKILADPQASGSAITYNRRYALVTLFALEQEDDDGQQANRAVKNPTQRTGAEKEIRAGIAKLDKADRERFVADFRDEFGCSLSDLPESAHGDALGYWKFWSQGGSAEEAPASTEAEEGASDGEVQ